MYSAIPTTDDSVFLAALSDRNAQLDLIQAITQKMLQMAKQQAWENINKLEAERSHLIYSFFETKPSVAEAEHVANIILEVLSADKAIIALSLSEQHEIMGSAQKINRGKQASKAYAMSEK